MSETRRTTARIPPDWILIPLVGAAIAECPECFALVRAERVTAHDDWHDLKWPRSES